jgi:hypothetical protein
MLDAQPSEPDTSAHLANALRGLTRLRAAETCFGWHEAGDCLAVPYNDHFFALLDQIEQLAKPIFRLEGTDLLHAKRRMDLG